MKVITDKYQNIALIECSCCRETHTVRLTKDDYLNELWFTFVDSKYSFTDRLRHKLHLLLDSESFVTGDGRFENGVLLSKEQLRSLSEVLSFHYEPLPISGYAKENVNLRQGKIEWITTILYDKDELILTLDDDQYCIGYHLSSASQAWPAVKANNFWNGNWECGISTEDARKFLWLLQQELQ